MSNLVEKAEQLFKTLVDGKVEVSVNFATGSIAINDIEFTPAEQLELMNEYVNDPTFSRLMKLINKTPEAQLVKSAVKFDAGTFKVDPAQVEKDFGIKLETPVKDAYIRELEETVSRLEKENKVLANQARVIKEEDLTIDDFTQAVLADGAKQVTAEDVEDILEELKDLDVPDYSFILHRVGNLAILKISDDQGISYLITNDYFYANVV